MGLLQSTKGRKGEGAVRILDLAVQAKRGPRVRNVPAPTGEAAPRMLCANAIYARRAEQVAKYAG